MHCFKYERTLNDLTVTLSSFLSSIENHVRYGYSMSCKTKFMISYREMLLNSWASVLNFLFAFLFMGFFYDAAKMILLYFMLKMLTGHNKLKALFCWTLQRVLVQMFCLINFDSRVLSYLWMLNYLFLAFTSRSRI